MSLLTGIMTFSEPTLVSEYEIDFWSHDGVTQQSLLNKFIGRHLGDSMKGEIGATYLAHVSRDKLFTSIFLFGVKRGNRRITPSSDFFIDNYYRRHVLLSSTDYRRAIDLFYYRSFSEFIGEQSTVQKLNEMNLKGRLEIFNFLAKKLFFALEKKTDLLHDSHKELFFNLLTKKIFSLKTTDIGNWLRNIFFTRSNDIITLSINYGKEGSQFLMEQVSLEVTYEELNEIITPEQLFTMCFYTGKTSLKGYYLDFDLAWRDLAEKVGKAYTLLKDMLSKAPIAPKETLNVKFYQRSATGIKPITEKTYSLLSTKFSQSGFDIKIDPENQEDLETKVLSMIFWMIMEPNIIPVVKLPNGDNFIIMDIYELYNGDLLSGTFSPPSDYEQRQKQFFGIFTRSDLMSFINFHNHEQSDEHSDMISYVMEKFKGLYVLLGGNTRSDLIDLR